MTIHERVSKALAEYESRKRAGAAVRPLDEHRMRAGFRGEAFARAGYDVEVARNDAACQEESDRYLQRFVESLEAEQREMAQ